MKLRWWRSDPASWTQQIQSLKTDTPLALPPIRPLAAQVAHRPRKKAKKLAFRLPEAK